MAKLHIRKGRILCAVLCCFFMLRHAPAAAVSPAPAPYKIISVIVNTNGMALVGRDTLTLTQLTPEIQSRLWKSYLGTGKMYDALKVIFAGDVPEEVRKATLEAVQEAQHKALTDYCLDKHHKRFDDLSSNQQKKIRKQFPVLFQIALE